jgi:hypothetical protein
METDSESKKRKRKVKVTGVRVEDYQDAGPPRDAPPVSGEAAPSSAPQAEPEQTADVFDGGPAPSPPPS